MSVSRGLAVLVAAALFVSVVEAAVLPVFVPIISLHQQVNPDGTYQYSYATANGIMAIEEGGLKNAGTPNEAMAVKGVYTYLNNDGTLVNVRYIADEGGFRAVPNVVFRPYPDREPTHLTHDAIKQALQLY